MIQSSIFNNTSKKQFEQSAIEIFRFQAEHCKVYQDFIRFLKVDVTTVSNIKRIPFLPIQFFKSHKVISSKSEIQQTFLSSGTTGTQSHHFVTELSLYEESYKKGFSYFYENIEDYTVLALLPNYLEREGSSLIYMVNDLIKKSKNSKSGFFLDDTTRLSKILQNQLNSDKKILLLGVSYALLDLIEAQQFNLKNSIVMETGGMKGRRKEMIREELHAILKKGFGINEIHSEYGMTELLSQAYSKGNGIFECPPWMDILIRDTEDPLTLLPNGKAGGMNVIDLANINSCSFIATQDLGKKHDNGTFEILGRFDNSDIRGCNLLIN
ncbi:MAG: acyl transferase [Flavobacteriaceae bacterium]